MIDDQKGKIEEIKQQNQHHYNKQDAQQQPNLIKEDAPQATPKKPTIQSKQSAEVENISEMSRITDFFGAKGSSEFRGKLPLMTEVGALTPKINQIKGNIIIGGVPSSEELAAAQMMMRLARMGQGEQLIQRGDPSKLHDDRHTSTDASSSPAHNQLLPRGQVTGAVLSRPATRNQDEDSAGMLADQENIMMISQKMNKVRKEDASDLKFEKSPAMSLSLDRSDKKANKSLDGSLVPNGDASQSIGSDGRPKHNRDICNTCRQGGNLLCCDNCPRSYHFKCLGVKQADLPEGDWFCHTCVSLLQKKRQQEEERQKKLQEKERQIEFKRKQKEDEDRAKQAEADKKREEKRREKERIEEEKRQQKEKLEEEKKREKEQAAEQKRLKEEEAQEAKRLREIALAEEKAKKIAEQAEAKRLKEEQAAEAKRKREEEEAEKKKKREEDLAEAKRKREENLAAMAEVKRLRELQQAEAKANKLQKGGSQQSQGSAECNKNEETKKDSVSKQIVVRKAEEKTEAEKAKEARQREMRNQFKIFSQFFPELTEKHSIKYPIEDKLLALLPILHNIENFPPRPEAKKILVDGPTFERLLYIWEFFNNFCDFLKVQPFKLEELYAALTFGTDGAAILQPTQPLEDDEEPEWEDYITNKTVIEQGFGLINSLHLAVIEVFFSEIRSTMDEKALNKADSKDQSNGPHSDDQLLLAVIKYFEAGTGEQHHWPELIRILLKSKRFSFHPLTPQLLDLCDTYLSNCVPENYSLLLTLPQKLDLLETLVDGLHDLEEFKDFLNQRVEERSSFNKQKMDIYSEIKQLDLQKLELLKDQQNSLIFSNSDLIFNQIEELKKKMEGAGRMESKRIQAQIGELENEKNKVIREIERVDEQIEKRHAKIERLNEQANKTSIKNQAIGKDAQKNEYWFFKEESSKLFVKKLSEDGSFQWQYYDQEEQLDRLIESCNYKGIREKRLQENLKKIKDRIKLKKSKTPKIQGISNGPLQQTLPGLIAQKTENQNKAQNEDSKDVNMKEEGVDEKKSDYEESEEEEEEKNNHSDKHILFENDNFFQTIINAAWLGKKMPSKRQIQMENRALATRRGSAVAQIKDSTKKSEDIKPSLVNLKEAIIQIESLYTDSGLPLNREWDVKPIRDQVRQQVQDANTVQEVALLLLRLDQGFSHPNYLKYKNAKEEEEEEEEEESNDSNSESSGSDENSDQNSDQEQEEEKNGDANVRIMKMKLFKYWPSRALRMAWRDYVFSEATANNILALSVAVRILERVNGEYLQRSFDLQQKKLRKEQQAFQKAQVSSTGTIKKPVGRPPNNAIVQGRGKQQKSYKEYFQSDEEGGSSDESDEVPEETSSEKVGKRKSARQAAAQSSSNQPPRGRGRPKRKISSSGDEQSEEEEEIDQSDEDMDEDNDSERSWDDKCYICGKRGNLICCEGCSHVAHIACLGLKKSPEGDWHCEDCLVKMTQRRTTRGQISQQNKSSRSERSNKYR